MAQALGSKEAQAHLIDPLNAPEPSQETGLNARFGSTFAPGPQKSTDSSSPPTASSPSFRNFSRKPAPASKDDVTTTTRPVNGGSSPRERFPDYRAEAFSGLDDAAPQTGRRRAATHTQAGPPPAYQELDSGRPRRRSSLRERYPGDKSTQPLEIIRRDSKKAYRSPHLHKKSLPGADMIDRLDPAIGGRAYHHEGPYDAALLARNRDPRTAPLAALQGSNEETLKATPRENIKDAVERHQPLDGVAVVPPGVPDQFGRTYRYEEGADLMHEASSGDAGYKRWPGKDYDRDDLKGESEPMFSLDRALRAHRIDDHGAIEMEDRAHLMEDYHRKERKGTLDARDPVEIAGDDGKYVDMELAAQGEASGSGVKRSTSLGGSLKKRIGSLRKKRHEE